MIVEPPPHRVERTPDVDAFLARVTGFLAPREAENNLVFGICSGLKRATRPLTAPPQFLVVTAADGGVAGAALQTPPFNLVLADGGQPWVERVLARTLAGASLPGVTGPVDAAGRFARSWTEFTGEPARHHMAERIFRLTLVRPPRPASGAMRPAGFDDRALLVAWLQAFNEEALGEPSPDAPELVDRWLTGGRTLVLWEDGGRPTSLVGVGGETPNGIRVGPVYTPPEDRGHGYASNLVAVASQAELDAGRQFVFLFADLANPTANRIYQAIGYEPVSDYAMYRFEG